MQGNVRKSRFHGAVSLAVERGGMLQEGADSTEMFGLREYRLQIERCRVIDRLLIRNLSKTWPVVRGLRVEGRINRKSG